MSDNAAHAAFLKMLEKISHQDTCVPPTRNENLDADKLGERVGAVAKLVNILVESGYKDFKSLATYIYEQDAAKYERTKPVLRSVWNAVADAKGFDDVSRSESETIYATIEKQNLVSEKQEPPLQSDCLYELEDKVKHHREWLEEWKRNHPQATKAKDMDKSLNNSIIIAAIIIGVAIIIAAFISRPSSSARYKSTGTDRIFDVQTGEVKIDSARASIERNGL